MKIAQQLRPLLPGKVCRLYSVQGMASRMAQTEQYGIAFLTTWPSRLRTHQVKNRSITQGSILNVHLVSSQII